MALIMIEGADNTGKTTLAEKLLKWDPLRLQLWNKQVRGPKDRVTYLKELDQVLKIAFDKDQRVPVADRLYFVEFAYRNVLKDKPITFSLSDQEVLETLIKLTNPLVIHCKVSPEVIAKTYNEREQFPSYEQNIRVMEEYDAIFAEVVPEIVPWYIEFDFTKDSFFNLTMQIDNYLKVTEGVNNYEYKGF